MHTFQLEMPYLSMNILNLTSSNNSALIRSDVANTFDIIVLKPLGDFFPFLDPNKLINLSFSYDKTISEANIINYDYVAESFGFGISRSFNLR